MASSLATRLAKFPSPTLLPSKPPQELCLHCCWYPVQPPKGFHFLHSDKRSHHWGSIPFVTNLQGCPITSSATRHISSNPCTGHLAGCLCDFTSAAGFSLRVSLLSSRGPQKSFVFPLCSLFYFCSVPVPPSRPRHPEISPRKIRNFCQFPFFTLCFILPRTCCQHP